MNKFRIEWGSFRGQLRLYFKIFKA